VGAFLDDAEAILKAAEAAAESALSTANTTILISSKDGIHIPSGSDWPLASLEAHYGARAAYRLSQVSGHVTVEGRSGNQQCRLESEHLQAVARRLLAGPLPTLPALIETISLAAALLFRAAARHRNGC
jgi:hypothetical protein